MSGRAAIPVPLAAGGILGQLAKRAGIADFSQDQMRFLAWGRGMDTTRMREVLCLEPEFTTRGAFEDFISSVGAGLPGGAAIGAALSGLAGSAVNVLGHALTPGRND
jgi:UDP-glucose 4-epimerase